MNEEKSAKDQLVIVESRSKVKVNNDIVLTVKAKDLPEGIKKEDLVAAFRENAEKEEEKQQGEKSKFKAKFLIPVLLPLALVAGIKGCQKQVDNPGDVYIKPTEAVVLDVKDIGGVVYAPESPYTDMEAVVNARGQEGMTTNILNGEHAMHGKNYDSNEQFENEERASEGQEEFEQMEEILKQNMATLINPDASQVEKREAARSALEINQKIEAIYTGNLEFIEAQGSSFEESSRAFEDSNTEAEIKVIRATIDEYKENKGLTALNVETLGQIVVLADNGYSIEITGEEVARGDYTISGQAVKEVAEEVGIDREAEETFNSFMEEKQQNLDKTQIGGDGDAR